jgi:hypothetical protein
MIFLFPVLRVGEESRLDEFSTEQAFRFPNVMLLAVGEDLPRFRPEVQPDVQLRPATPASVLAVPPPGSDGLKKKFLSGRAVKKLPRIT